MSAAKCPGCDPAEGFCKECREAEKAKGKSMKTQFTVTITQTGKDRHTPAALERDLRAIVKDIWESPESSVTARHVMEDTTPAEDTLEALVREYGTAPTMGKGRNRSDVMNDIRALMPVPGSQVAENSAKPSVPVEEAVATLNAMVAHGQGEALTVGRKVLRKALSDAHRSGQLVGRLLGKEGREKADAHADFVVTSLAHLGE